MEELKLSVDLVVEKLDHRLESVVGGNQIRLQRKFGLAVLVSYYIEAFSRIRNWPGRLHIMFWLVRYARSHPEVRELARVALSDKSSKVRYDACGALAYAQDPASLPFLEPLLAHKNARTRSDAAAAINAIKKRNHHFYFDREETGKAFWKVNPEDP